MRRPPRSSQKPNADRKFPVQLTSNQTYFPHFASLPITPTLLKSDSPPPSSDPLRPPRRSPRRHRQTPRAHSAARGARSLSEESKEWPETNLAAVIRLSQASILLRRVYDRSPRYSLYHRPCRLWAALSYTITVDQGATSSRASRRYLGYC